jgi:hypothetical protein
MKVFESEITQYFSIAKEKIRLTRKVNELFGKELATNFNSINFWWRNFHENKVSEILAFFLDPKQEHQQGDTFLKLFLNKLDLDFKYNTINEVKVRCEAQTDSNRRIDILISNSSTNQLIGIENKIEENTKDQSNQVIDYLHHLENRSPNKNFILLYLSPSRKELSNDSISEKDRIQYEKNLRIINYEQHIIPCIKEFNYRSENIRVKSFLQDFERKLTQKYLGINNINEMESIKEHVLESFEVSILVSQALEAVKIELLTKFEEMLKEFSKEKEFIEFNIESRGKNKYFSFKPLKWGNHKITIAYEYNDLLIGITKIIPNQVITTLPKVYMSFNETKPQLVTVGWPVYFIIYSSFLNNSKFWIELHNGKVDLEIKNIINQFVENYEEQEKPYPLIK